jgi:hypothetical protein
MKKYFKVLWFMLGCLLAGITNSHAQEVGLSFSYFIPKNGYLSTPISPFSIRGLGFDLNNFVSIESGVSLYRMNGLNIKDLPFDSQQPLLGPNFTLFVPVELVLAAKGQSLTWKVKGGGFAFYGFDNKLNYGNIDRLIRESENWEIVNANLDFKNNPGFGFHFGTELTFYINRQFGISLEGNYLMGDAKFPLNGTYRAVNSAGDIQTINANYENARIDFTGLEISIGVIFTTR